MQANEAGPHSLSQVIIMPMSKEMEAHLTQIGKERPVQVAKLMVESLELLWSYTTRYGCLHYGPKKGQENALNYKYIP